MPVWLGILIGVAVLALTWSSVIFTLVIPRTLQGPVAYLSGSTVRLAEPSSRSRGRRRSDGCPAWAGRLCYPKASTTTIPAWCRPPGGVRSARSCAIVIRGARSRRSVPGDQGWSRRVRITTSHDRARRRAAHAVHEQRDGQRWSGRSPRHPPLCAACRCSPGRCHNGRRARSLVRLMFYSRPCGAGAFNRPRRLGDV